MKILRGCAALAAAALICAAGAGCSFRPTASPDELYSLPQLPEQYKELEKSLDAVQSDGAEYAAPLSGTNIQPVQLVDLNGDGKEEALAFFRKSTDEKPLKIYIFTPRGETYEQLAVIEGSGSSIYSIAYSDMDRDGKVELLVGWKVGTDLQALSVYTLRSDEPEALTCATYVKYVLADLDQDRRQELVVLHADSEGSSVADLYAWAPTGTLTLSATARLSMTMAEMNAGRVKSGMLRDETPALFVTGVENSSMEITDILTTRQGDFLNLALSAVTGVSTEIYRYLSLYPTDINGDGITELPAPVSLPSAGEDPPPEPCYRIDWRSYGIDGSAQTALSTYHNTDDGWYLVLPGEWTDRIAVTRIQVGGNETVVTMTLRGTPQAAPQEFLSIWTMSGENRESRAVGDGRFVLSRRGAATFAAKLLPGAEALGLTEESLRARFNLITREWLPGDN